MTKFDVEAVLRKVRSGEIVIAEPPTIPADKQTCSNPLCESGTVYVSFTPGQAAVARPCPTCAERHRRTVGQKALEEAGVAGTIYAANWSEIDLSHESWQLAHEYALSAAEMVRENSGLIFVGDYGRGKTQAATMILAHAAEAGHTVARVKWGKFTRRVRSTYGSKEGPTEDDMITGLAAPDLILLDDVGAADKQSDHNERLLTSVIDERYDAGRPTILTSNLSREELEAQLGRRAFERLWNNGAVVIFNGPNYRELIERPQTKSLHARIKERAAQRASERHQIAAD